MPKKLLLLVALLLVSTACRDDDPPPPDAGVSVGDGGVPLDCGGLLVCAAECPDDACADACIARTTTDGISRASALVECVEREGCGEDSSCIEARCAAEVAACLETPIVPGGDAGVPSDPFPARIVGTTRDTTAALGRTIDSSSNGTTVFVRDDAAGEAAGFPVAVVAFYRLESITYRATLSSNTPSCTSSADFTETFTSPDPFETNLMIERAAGPDGLHAYGFSTGLRVVHPGGEVIVCDPTGTTTADFEAAHFVVHGIDEPRTDLRTFTGTYVQGGVRTMTWDLRAAD